MQVGVSVELNNILNLEWEKEQPQKSTGHVTCAGADRSHSVAIRTILPGEYAPGLFFMEVWGSQHNQAGMTLPCGKQRRTRGVTEEPGGVER